MQGIYTIVNIINGRCYIGSSVDVLRRLSEHISQLGRGAHVNWILQRAYVKYGATAFDLRILEEVEEKNLLQGNL